MEPVLHVGYPKTASTWLQRHVFPHHPELCMPFTYRELRDTLIAPHVSRFDVDAWKARLDERLAATPDRLPVISNEHFVGFAGNHGYDTLGIADRLRSLFPDARVVLIIREQESMVASMYSELVKGGGTAPLKRYLDPPRGDTPLATYLDYDWIEHVYRERFEDVQVMPFEAFRADRTAFLHRLSDFAGVEHWTPPAQTQAKNLRLSPSASGALRIANRVLRPHNRAYHRAIRLPGRYHLQRVLGRYDRVVGRRIRPNSHARRIRAWAGDRFRDSNRRLAKRIGIDLQGLGYRC